MTSPRSSATTAKTPRELGYRMPAEWVPHAATWLAWPHDPVTWPGRVPQVEDAYIEILRALTPHERVELLVKDASLEERVRRRLLEAKISNVNLHRISTADSWIRDYGPTFVKDRAGGLAFVDWIFNAWGNKYETLLPDDQIPPKLEKILGVPRFECNVVMEGGSIDVNGAGVVLTTEQCLLNKNRNPDLSKAQVEAVLKDHLGVDTVLWLKEGIEGDDTDGHIDDIARFVDETTIVAAVEDDKKDPNHAILADNLKRLKSFKAANGHPYKIMELPMPGTIRDEEGRLPASYANFYVANQTVLLPVFGDKNDERAQKVLQTCFPDRRVVPIRCEDVVYGMGTIHCLSQQQPS